MLILAQNTDWIETIVIVAVIALSALKPVASFLIRKFTPKKETDSRARRDDASQTAPTSTARPVARPLPPRPVVSRSEPTHRESSPIPEPLRDILTELIPELVPPRVRPPVTPKTTPAADSVHRGSVTQATRREKPERATRRSQTRNAPRREQTIARADIGGVRLPSEIDPQHSGADAAPQAPPEVHPAEQADAYTAIRLPTRASLRQAILMNEILSPPVAMRDARELPG